MMRFWAAAAAAAFALAADPTSGRDLIPPVELAPFFRHLRFEKAACLAFPPDGSGRLFVAEQLGKVVAVDFRPDARERRVVLDLTARLSLEDWEEGLLGIAFHPRFAENRWLFVEYSAARPRRRVVSRFRLDGPAPEEKVVLEIPHPQPRHYGGSLCFGPDGFLYLGVGDGGTSPETPGVAQSLDSLLGKFLRIDPDRETASVGYGVPADNPFVGRPGARPEIWATGFRNPWGFHFDRETGRLWSADVGEIGAEEINLVRRGGNYGWDFLEGRAKIRLGGRGIFEEPIVIHRREDARSLTGGIVYRGVRRPDLQGVYLYGDYVTGNVWGLRWAGGRIRSHRMLAGCNQIAAFAEDPEGEVYLSSFDGCIYAFR